MNLFKCIIYTVTNLDAAKAMHAAVLGVAPHTDQPYYVGFNVGGFDIALVPHDPKGDRPQPIAYIAIDDLDDAIADAQCAGATVLSEPHDVGGGIRLATLNDLGGNITGLITQT